MRLECRYSSSEMFYLEVTSHDVRSYLDHSPDQARYWSFEEVLSDELERDIETSTLFPSDDIAKLKEVVRLRALSLR